MVFLADINNHKLAIITPTSIVCRGDLYGEKNHEEVMIEYGIERYGSNSIFGVLEKQLNFKLAQYYLVSYHNILFYNLSRGDYKFGIFYVLNNINEKQLRLVQDFLNCLEEFKVELDSFVEVGGQLIVNDPIEESYDDFAEIRQYFNDITVFSKKK